MRPPRRNGNYIGSGDPSELHLARPGRVAKRQFSTAMNQGGLSFFTMNQPNYMGWIPAPLRYHKDIPASAKLLFSELTSLANSTGFCWATNSYFAELYGVAQTTISEWVRALKDAGFIRVEIDKKGGNQRRVFITGGLRDSGKTSSAFPEEGSSAFPEPSILENSTLLNSTVKASQAPHGNSQPNSIKTKARKEIKSKETDLLAGAGAGRKKFIPPTKAEVELEMRGHGLNGDAANEAAKFTGHHGMLGWKIGSRPMVDWKCAVQKWIAQKKDFAPAAGSPREPTLRDRQDALIAESKRRSDAAEEAAERLAKEHPLIPDDVLFAAPLRREEVSK